MAWTKTEDGFVYTDQCSADLEIIITSSPLGRVAMRFDNWLVNEATLLELANALLDLRKELYGD
jgi:hypothetical protein